MGGARDGEWAPVNGFEGIYKVNRRGDVRNVKDGRSRPLKKKHNRFTGYDFYDLYRDGKTTTRTVHRVVAEAFIPNPDGLPCVNHIDEDKANNNVENLEWCTVAYNNDWSKHKRYKPVVLYSVDGEKLATFESERAAAELLKVGKAAICNALARGTTCNGFILKRGEK